MIIDCNLSNHFEIQTCDFDQIFSNPDLPKLTGYFILNPQTPV